MKQAVPETIPKICPLRVSHTMVYDVTVRQNAAMEIPHKCLKEKCAWWVAWVKDGDGNMVYRADCCAIKLLAEK